MLIKVYNISEKADHEERKKGFHSEGERSTIPKATMVDGGFRRRREGRMKATGIVRRIGGLGRVVYSQGNSQDPPG